jgi:hypothetical protein
MATHQPTPRSLSAYQVRRLLDDLLRTDGDLQAFLVDEFRAVQLRFSAEMTRERRVSLLFEAVGEQTVAEHLAARDPVAFAKAVARLPQHVQPSTVPPRKRRGLGMALGLLGVLAVAWGTYRLVRPDAQPVPRIDPSRGDPGQAPVGASPTKQPTGVPDRAVAPVAPLAAPRVTGPKPPAIANRVASAAHAPTARHGPATCQGTRCVLSGVTRAELGDSLICLDPQRPDDPSQAEGTQPTCTLTAGGGPPVCFRSDEQAQRALLGPIRWRTPCP